MGKSLIYLFVLLAVSASFTGCGKKSEPVAQKKEPEKIIRYLDKDSVLNDYFITCLYNDGEKLWIGSRKGLYLFAGNGIENAPEPLQTRFHRSAHLSQPPP